MLSPGRSCFSFPSPVENLLTLQPLFISLQVFLSTFPTVVDLISTLSGWLHTGGAMWTSHLSGKIPTCDGYALDRHNFRAPLLGLHRATEVPSHVHHFCVPYCSDTGWLGNETHFLALVFHDEFLGISPSSWPNILLINRKMKFCEIMLVNELLLV